MAQERQYIAAYIPRAHYRALKKRAKESDMSFSAVLRSIIAQSVNRGKKNVKKVT